jgi:hypothetical protein
MDLARRDATGFGAFVETAKEELQRLKPFSFCTLYVAAEAATRKARLR